MCGQAASSSGGTPSPVTAEIVKNGSRSSRARCLERASTRSGSSTASILFATTSSGLSSSVAIVEAELAANDLEVLDRIAPRRAGHVDQMDQHLRALDVTQKLMAESVALVRAFDQPGHVGDDEAALVAQRDDAEIGRERRERIVGDLRPGRRNAGDQRRLAGVGKSDQADVGEQLQLEPEMPLLAGLAGLVLARGAIGRRREVGVAQSAAAAFRDEDALARLRQVGEHLRGIRHGGIVHVDECADRDGDVEVVALAAGLQRACAAAAALRPRTPT